MAKPTTKSDYDKLSSIFSPVPNVETKYPVVYTEFTQMSEFNIDKLFEDVKMTEHKKEKQKKEEDDGFSPTSPFDLNMIGGGADCDFGEVCKP